MGRFKSRGQCGVVAGLDPQHDRLAGRSVTKYNGKAAARFHLCRRFGIGRPINDVGFDSLPRPRGVRPQQIAGLTRAKTGGGILPIFAGAAESPGVQLATPVGPCSSSALPSPG